MTAVCSKNRNSRVEGTQAQHYPFSRAACDWVTEILDQTRQAGRWWTERKCPLRRKCLFKARWDHWHSQIRLKRMSSVWDRFKILGLNQNWAILSLTKVRVQYVSCSKIASWQVSLVRMHRMTMLTYQQRQWIIFLHQHNNRDVSRPAIIS